MDQFSLHSQWFIFLAVRVCVCVRVHLCVCACACVCVHMFTEALGLYGDMWVSCSLYIIVKGYKIVKGVQ